MKYAHLIISIDKKSWTNSSFDHDGHENTLLANRTDCKNENVLGELRLDTLKLLCEVTFKYETMRQETPLMEKKHGSIANPSSTSDDKCCEDCEDDSCTTTESESSVSSNSDSTFHLFDEEPDYSDEMYNRNQNISNAHPSHHSEDTDRIPDNEDDSSVEETQDDDDSSIEEMYSDFKEDKARQRNFTTHWDDEDTDNLVCPGDVLEYCTANSDERAPQSSVDTIIEHENGSNSYVVLKNSIVLNPEVHLVRKVAFYDGCNEKLIPNPLAEWHRLDKCILQPVVDPVDIICPGDLIDYCTIDCVNTSKRSSVVTIVRGQSQMIIVKNGDVLHSGRNLLRRVHLFDKFKRKQIPNPLSAWHRLEACTLKPGTTPSDDVMDVDDIGPDSPALVRARLARRRQNKQR